MNIQVVIEEAIPILKEEFSRLSFDERDNYPDLQFTVEKILRRPMTKQELLDPKFQTRSRLIEEATDAADHLAHTNRVGDGCNQNPDLAIAEARLAYEQALSKI